MKHLKKYFFAALLFTASLTTFAQVGIGTETPTASLDIVGDPTNSAAMDGVIYPQLTGDQLRTKTYTPTQMGAMVYVTAADTAPAGQTINVTSTGYYSFDGTVWIPFSISPADIPRGLGYTVTTDPDYLIQPTDVFIEYTCPGPSVTAINTESFALITFPPNMPIGRIFYLYHNANVSFLDYLDSQSFSKQNVPNSPTKHTFHRQVQTMMHLGNDLYVAVDGS